MSEKICPTCGTQKGEIIYLDLENLPEKLNFNAEDLRKIMYETPMQFISNPSIAQIKETVNNNPNDFILGQEIRKLFL